MAVLIGLILLSNASNILMSCLLISNLEFLDCCLELIMSMASQLIRFSWIWGILLLSSPMICLPPCTSNLLDVYIFDERCNLWTHNYTVGPLTIPRKMFLTHCFRNGDLLFNENKGDLLLVSVNPQTHTITRLETYAYDSSRFNLFLSYSFDYIESLASVKGMNLLHVPYKENNILIIEKSFWFSFCIKILL